jgi:2-polyprenyl-3-methyl-5-hydroxy-6-metoxy-1,4-benzoquinol methylase
MNALKGPSSDWERFGELDPYWAVLTDEKFRASKINSDARRQFFESGETHVDRVVETVRASVHPGFSPRRVLDFGCGVGRVLIPLAKRYPESVGMDVATSMLREAASNLAEKGVIAELVLYDEALTRLTGTFDFIHSYIVFQHIPPARGLRTAANLAKGRPAASPRMEVFEYDLVRVFETLRGADCSDLRLVFTDHGGVRGAFVFCRKHARAESLF